MYNRNDLDLGERREESDPFIFIPSPPECLLIWTMWEEITPRPDAVRDVLWEAWSDYIANCPDVKQMVDAGRQGAFQADLSALVKFVDSVRQGWAMFVVRTVTSMAADEHPMLTDYVTENYGDQIPHDVPWGRH